MGVSIITFLLLRVFVDESRDTGPLSIFDKILPGSNSNSSSNKRLKVATTHTLQAGSCSEFRVVLESSEESVMRNPNFGLSSIFLSLAVVGQIQALQSPLIGSKWRVSLDMGREDNTWMPENWAASGARLGLDTTVEFTDFDVETHEPLISKQGAAKALRVCSGPSSFTAENGTRKVIFKGGGYYLTRVHGMVPGAEAVLRFWLDCDTGAARRDVSVAKNTRIFFSTGLWDDMVGLEVLTARRDELVAEMDALLEAEKSTRPGRGNTAPAPILTPWARPNPPSPPCLGPGPLARRRP